MRSLSFCCLLFLAVSFLVGCADEKPAPTAKVSKGNNRFEVFGDKPKSLPEEKAAKSKPIDKESATKEEPESLTFVDSDWPRMFGPTNDSHSPERIVCNHWPASGPKEIWRNEVGIGYSTPIISDGRVIVLHRVEDEELVECFDLESGDSLWQHRYPTTYVCEFEYSSGPYSTPAVQDGLVYTFGAQWQARCLNLEDGSVVWERDLSEDYPLEEGLFGFGASPYLDDERIVINLGSSEAGVVALDLKTGETLWTATNHRAGYATPRLGHPHGKPTLFVVTYEGIVALDPVDGTEHWFESFFPKAPASVNATSPITWDNRVLMVTGPGPGALCVACQPDGSHAIAWRNRRLLDSQFNPLMKVGKHVFGFMSSRNDSAALRCVNIKSSKEVWSYKSDLERGTGIIADDRLLLWGEHGHLAVMEIDFEEPKLVWFSEEPLLETPCYSAPALSRGLLVLRNEGTLICLDTRPADAESDSE